jgi:hypothetical protein
MSLHKKMTKSRKITVRYSDCFKLQVAASIEKGGLISMTEENRLAERVNGILKDEFLLNTTFNNSAQAKRFRHASAP